MINFAMCALLLLCGGAFAILGIGFILQYRERATFEKLELGAFWDFHVRFGGILGIIGVILGILTLIFALAVGIFQPF